MKLFVFLASFFIAIQAMAGLIIEWEAIHDSIGYELRVTNRKDHNQTSFFQSKINKWTPKLPSGEYTLEVRAVRTNSNNSAWSDPVNFTINDSTHERVTSQFDIQTPKNPSEVTAKYFNGSGNYKSKIVGKSNIPVQFVELSLQFPSTVKNIFSGLGEIKFGKISNESMIQSNIALPFHLSTSYYKLYGGPLVSGLYLPEYLPNKNQIEANYLGALGPGIILGASYYISDNLSIESNLKFSILPIALTQEHKNISHRSLSLMMAWKKLIELEVTNGNYQYDRDSNLNITTVGIGFSSYF